MSINDLFTKGIFHRDEPVVDMPSVYRETVKWVPRLGDVMPDFHADSTRGRINFHDWAEGSWIVLFGYPRTRGGISETEIGSLSMHESAFKKRNVKAIGLSPATQGENADWEKVLERLFNIELTLPLMADPTSKLCRSLGMIHERDPNDVAIRKTIIIDPSLHLRWISEYPTSLGRSIDEIIRVIDGLQFYDETNLGVPMDWMPGDPGVVRPQISTAEARARYGDSLTVLASDIRMVNLPEGWFDSQQ